MADLVVFIPLVGVVAAVGIALGMLAGRRLGTWDDRRAKAEAAAATAPGGADAAAAPGRASATTAGSGAAPGNRQLEDGGDTVD